MNILFTDLDNTLIYSHHRKIGKSKIVVEHLDGREQSFMTEYAYDFFSSADWLNIIPVTTRTEQQYKRLECTDKLRIKYAIVCNGGKMLINGKEDEEWSHETFILNRDNYDYIEAATEQLLFLCKNENVYRPDKYMTYAKCSDPEKIYRELTNCVDPNKVNVQRDNKKVYLFSNGVSKGRAVERFMMKRGRGIVLAAGDNTMDISMLKTADYAFTNLDIYEQIKCPNIILIEKDVLSDGICEHLCTMRRKNII